MISPLTKTFSTTDNGMTISYIDYIDWRKILEESSPRVKNSSDTKGIPELIRTTELSVS